MSEQAYSVGIGLSVVPYIGPDLYSNVPAVISELIANAWDAGATVVRININLSNDTLTIEDDGKGMSFGDINTKYLRIGFKKRLTSGTTFVINGKQRHVMGRKGIGKLAPFALAEELEIHSSSGQERVGCIIKWSEFKSAIDSDATEFKPTPLVDSSNSVNKGTKLILRNIRDDKKNSLKDISKLRKLVARRFTVIHPDHDFDVQIDDISITDQDRPYLHKVEFLWCLGDHNQSISNSCTNLLRNPIFIGDTISVNGTAYNVTGWVGTVEQPSDISADGNATIAIFAHGKLVQEDILGELGEKQVFASYVVGDIQANFLDYDDENDIVTPDRQRLNQSDPRYIKLREYVKSVALSEISKNWSLWRLERYISDALSILEINEWYSSLNKSKKDSAARIFRKISELKNLGSDEKKKYNLSVIDHFDHLSAIPSLTKLRDSEFIEVFKKLCQSNTSTPPKSENGASDGASTSNSDNNSTTDDSKPNEDDQTSNPTDSSESAGTGSSENETQTNAQPDNDDQAAEGERPEGNRPANPKSPKYQANYHFDTIRKAIKQMAIEKELKDVALFDLNEAQIAYNNTASKACIVMLGAVVEGIMLATLRRHDVLLKLNQMPVSDLPKPLLNIGILKQPPNLQELANAIATSRLLGFEEYRQIIIKLIPDIENQKVENIQHFRNSVHPYKAVEEPNVFGNPDSTRAMNYITSLEIIVKQVVAWTP